MHAKSLFVSTLLAVSCFTVLAKAMDNNGVPSPREKIKLNSLQEMKNKILELAPGAFRSIDKESQSDALGALRGFYDAIENKKFNKSLNEGLREWIGAMLPEGRSVDQVKNEWEAAALFLSAWVYFALTDDFDLVESTARDCNDWQFRSNTDIINSCEFKDERFVRFLYERIRREDAVEMDKETESVKIRWSSNSILANRFAISPTVVSLKRMLSINVGDTPEIESMTWNYLALRYYLLTSTTPYGKFIPIDFDSYYDHIIRGTPIEEKFLAIRSMANVDISEPPKKRTGD